MSYRLLIHALFVFIALTISPSIKAESPEKVTLLLQWKHQFEFAGFYAALEQGYYQEAGLDVEFIEPDGLTSSTEAVTRGKVDYAVSGSSALLEYVNGQPVVMLANFFKRSPLAIAAQKEIKTPKDLIGKTMMASLASGFKEVSLLAMLNQFNVTPSQIEFKAPNYRLQSFLDRDVDAIVIFTTNELFDLEHREYPFTLLDPIQYGISDYEVNLITSQRQWQTNPERAQRFTESSTKGWEYALQHPEEVVDWILQKYNTQNKTREQLLEEAHLTHQVIMPELYPLGSIDKQRLMQSLRTLSENQLVAANANSDLTTFIPTVQKNNDYSPKQLEYIENKRQITFCADPNWMPFEAFEQGIHVGMSADYLAILSKRSGLKFKLVPTRNWSESLEYAKQRRCDLFSLAMDTPERRVYMNFTQTVFHFPVVLATQSSTLFIDDLEEVLSKPIGIVKGYAYYELLRAKYPEINLIEVDSVDQGLEWVRRNRLFGFVDSLATVGYTIQKDFVGELHIAGKFSDEWHLAIGVRNDDPMMLEVINAAISKVSEEEKRDIYNKWIAVIYQEKVDYGFIVKWLLLIILIVILLVYHLRSQTSLLKRLQSANEEILHKNGQLEKLSITDKLTQLFNRHKLDGELQRQWRLFQRYQIPFSLLLIDIDHFKRINDTFGHLQGDLVLVDVAKCLQSSLRETDILGRWGGEEFLIICPSTQRQDAVHLAEKLCHGVAQIPQEMIGQVTVSIGVSEAQNTLERVDVLLKQADDALYLAKKSGRNQVKFMDLV